jgi:Domain of unknown function (DUF4865)
MLAMQYRIPLDDSYEMARIRARVAEKAALFDALPGLAQKAFLINERGAAGRPFARNEYAPFYVWRSVEAARRFLLGDKFGAVCDAFGRPPVRTWQILEFAAADAAVVPRFATLETLGAHSSAILSELAAAEREHHLEALRRPGLRSHAVGLDAELWEIVRFSLWAGAADAAPFVRECHDYEVLHLSAPETAASSLAAVA